MSRFSQRLVRWQREHGRHGLPWQHTQDPYRVWLSEIMLQQTQVVTVLAYYERFLTRFPDVRALARASQDDVLALWSGLGYYSRARNLHQCARQVCEDWAGEFPRRAEDLQTLAGIGPSTAAAIAAFCFGQRVSILDGNVKRVLARHAGMDLDTGSSAGVRALQTQAQSLLPARAADMPAYTQGLMDLGATLCVPRQPRCEDCPLAADCVAQAQGRQQELPVRTQRAAKRTERLWLWWCECEDGSVWLLRRPQQGIWAGLHAPPVFDSEAGVLAAAAQHGDVNALEFAPALRHILTHRELHLHSVWQRLPRQVRPWSEGRWVTEFEWAQTGLPAPLRKMLLSRRPARGGV